MKAIDNKEWILELTCYGAYWLNDFEQIYSVLEL